MFASITFTFGITRTVSIWIKMPPSMQSGNSGNPLRKAAFWSDWELFSMATCVIVCACMCVRV